MTTQTIRRFAAIPAVILATALTGCEDDGVTDPNDDIVGNFTATEAVFTDSNDLTNSFDVIEANGSLDMDFNQDGTFRSELNIPDRDPVVRTGTFERNGTDVLITENGATRTVTMERTGNDFVLDDPATEFAFAGGAPAPARLEARFQQR